MAVVQFEVSDEIAQRVRAFVESGRESRITFSVRARRVVSVSAEVEWPNEGRDVSTGGGSGPPKVR